MRRISKADGGITRSEENPRTYHTNGEPGVNAPSDIKDYVLNGLSEEILTVVEKAMEEFGSLGEDVNEVGESDQEDTLYRGIKRLIGQRYYDEVIGSGLFERRIEEVFTGSGPNGQRILIKGDRNGRLEINAPIAINGSNNVVDIAPGTTIVLGGNFNGAGAFVIAAGTEANMISGGGVVDKPSGDEVNMVSAGANAAYAIGSVWIKNRVGRDTGGRRRAPELTPWKL